MDRCPACSRPTRFYGIISRAAMWLRWDICDACDAFFVCDEVGAYVWGRRSIDRNGYPWLPPRAWFGAVPTSDAGTEHGAELTKLLAIIERARDKEPGATHGVTQAQAEAQARISKSSSSGP